MTGMLGASHHEKTACQGLMFCVMAVHAFNVLAVSPGREICSGTDDQE